LYIADFTFSHKYNLLQQILQQLADDNLSSNNLSILFLFNI